MSISVKSRPTAEPKLCHIHGHTPVRKIQVYLVAASRFMCYLTRGQLGALLPFLIVDLQLTSFDQGVLMSRYASGYILTQIIGGMLADKLGGYVVIAMVTIATSLCCISAQFLSNYGVEAFGIPFFIMGLCQGAVLPAGNVLMARWVLPSERSWASAVTGMGSCLGSLVISFIAAPIAARSGWQVVFCCSTALCLVFLAIWISLASSLPDACVSVSEDELALLRQAGLARAKNEAKELTRTRTDANVSSPRFSKCKSDTPKKRHHFLNLGLFLHASVWTVVFSHFVQNCQQYLTDWFPIFYSTQLGVNAEVAGFYLTVIASVELPARAATKSLPEEMGKRGVTLLRCRKTMSIQGFLYHHVLYSAVAMFLLMDVTSPMGFTILFAFAKAAQAFHAGGYYANYLDLTRNYAGMLTGIGNTIASTAGIIVPRFVAFNLQDGRGNWMPVMVAMLVLNIAAMAMCAKFMSTECLDDAIATDK